MYKKKGKPNSPDSGYLYRWCILMKLIILLVTTTTISSYATAFAQRITLNANGESFKTVLLEITKKTGYDFLYDGDILLDTKPVSVEIDDLSLDEALHLVIGGQNLHFEVKGTTVIVKKRAVTQRPALQQTRTVTGNVRDESGLPVAGATVRAGSSPENQTSTDSNGHFTLNVPTGISALSISNVGYQSETVVITSTANLTVVLRTQVSDLEEVVVVGYGTVRKSDLTGAVGKVTSDVLSQRPSINISQDLSGRLAGVNVATNSGRPGGRTSISIRGYSSISGGNEPLYVLDGVILTSDINDLNQNDIESVTVLKDASSTAIYGTRGSNGVILLTSKKGKNNKPAINYNGYLSTGIFPQDRKLDVLNAEEWLYLEEVAYENAKKFDPTGFASGRYPDPVQKRMNYLVGNENGLKDLFTLNADGIPVPIYDVDWQDMVFRTAVNHNHSLSFNGQTEKSSHYVSGGYAREQGIMVGSSLRRLNFRGVLDQQVHKHIKLGANLAFSDNLDNRTDENVDANNALRQTVEMVPFIPYKYPNGDYGYRGDYSGLENGDNPLAQLNEIAIQYGARSFNAQVYTTIDLLKGLQFTSTLGTNLTNGLNTSYNSKDTYLGDGIGKNSARVTTNKASYWQWSNRFNYSLTRGSNNLDVTAGMEQQEYQDYVYIAGTSMFDDYYKWNNLAAGEVPLAPSSISNAYRMLSFFGRANYSYKSKYLLTVTTRADGSSKFGAANKYAFFPSAAVGWVVSNEEFLRNSKLISNLKLRTSIGLTGNSEIGSYRSLANLATNTAVFGGSRATGTVIGTMANPVLQWEKTRQFDIGFDLGLFDNRVSIEADYFNKYTYDMLLNAPLPATSGYTSVTSNIGNMRNSGLELSFETLNISRKNIRWSTTFNLTYLQNEIQKLGVNNDDIIYGKRNAQILRVGESVGSFYGYIRDGVWGTAEEASAADYNKKPGDLKIKDLNNDGAITADDRTILGKGIPDFAGGFSTSLRYGNFDFVLDLQYSLGNEVFNDQRATGEARFGLANNFRTVLTDSWTPDRQDAPLEQVRPSGAGYGYYVDTRRVTNGSFLRGRNIALGYSLPSSTVSKLGLKEIRMNLSVQNFFLITPYWAYDPEVSTYDDVFAQGVTFASYPKPRIFMFGVNVGL